MARTKPRYQPYLPRELAGAIDSWAKDNSLNRSEAAELIFTTWLKPNTIRSVELEPEELRVLEQMSVEQKRSVAQQAAVIISESIRETKS